MFSSFLHLLLVIPLDRSFFLSFHLLISVGHFSLLLEITGVPSVGSRPKSFRRLITLSFSHLGPSADGAEMHGTAFRHLAN